MFFRKLQKCTLDNMAIFFHMLEIDDDEEHNVPASSPAGTSRTTVTATAPDADVTELAKLEMPELSKRQRSLLQGDRLKKAPKNLYVKVVEVSGDLSRCWLDFSKGERVDAPEKSEHSALRVRKKDK